MMCEEGEVERQEKQESLYTQNPSFIIRNTKSYHQLPPSAALFSQGLQWVPLTKQGRGGFWAGAGGGI